MDASGGAASAVLTEAVASVEVTVASWLALDRHAGLHRLRKVEASAVVEEVHPVKADDSAAVASSDVSTASTILSELLKARAPIESKPAGHGHVDGSCHLHSKPHPLTAPHPLPPPLLHSRSLTDINAGTVSFTAASFCTASHSGVTLSPNILLMIPELFNFSERMSFSAGGDIKRRVKRRRRTHKLSEIEKMNKNILYLVQYYKRFPKQTLRKVQLATFMT